MEKTSKMQEELKSLQFKYKNDPEKMFFKINDQAKDIMENTYVMTDEKIQNIRDKIVKGELWIKERN